MINVKKRFEMIRKTLCGAHSEDIKFALKTLTKSDLGNCGIEINRMIKVLRITIL